MSKNDDLVRRHLCGYPEFGTYEGQVVLVAPDFLKEKWPTGIGIDVCLALEIQNLWKAGIKTTGHCCGHGRSFPYIGVCPEHIEQMKAMGYEVQPNPSRPGDEDSFVPKTRLSDAIERGAAQEMVERACDAVEDYCSDMPDLAGHGHSVGLKDAIREALSTPPAPAPDAGEEWKMVPVKPTEKMIDESDYAMTIAGEHDGEAVTIWNAMLAAAPQPPVVEAEAREERCKFTADYYRPARCMNCGRRKDDPIHYPAPDAGETLVDQMPDAFFDEDHSDENPTVRDVDELIDPTPQPPAVDENGCYTLPNGDCISEGPCIHTPAVEAEAVAERYCEGWCKENGGRGKFDDCTGCEFEAALKAKTDEIERLTELADKYKWQVRDTCRRAEAAEASNKALREKVEKVIEDMPESYYRTQLAAALRALRGEGGVDG